MRQYFGGLIEELDQKEDFRKRKTYQISDLIFSCLTMFLFKHGSRNQQNNLREDSAYYASNFEALFNLRLAHMDTVDDFFRRFPIEHLEQIKVSMIRSLIGKKVLQSTFGYYFIVIDGTGIWSSSSDPGFGTHKESKNGVVSYHNNVLEAKIISSDGLALSIASEFIANVDGASKQDCELAAFKRLSVKLKSLFPRLKICLLADALYANNTFFNLCEENKWKYLVNLKAGSLRSLQEEIDYLNPEYFSQKQQVIPDKNTQTTKVIKWINKLIYKEHTLNWFSNVETKKHIKQNAQEQKIFTYLTNFELDHNNIITLNRLGRDRWKIENEGFNIQKNNGYALSHKFSRNNENASQNYYQVLQIAHLLNQLIQRTALVGNLLKKKGKKTIKLLDEFLIAQLIINDLKTFIQEHCIKKRFQIRWYL